MAIPQEDRRRTSTRVITLQVGVIIWFAALAICFWVLQVVQHEKYVQMADSNYQRTLALRAPRGVLFDRHGKVLVENRNSYTIAIIRENTKDMPRTVRAASAVLGLDVADVQEIVDRHRREPSYRPIVIVQDATLDQVAAVLTRKYELPEIDIQQVPTRKSPGVALAAHLFG
jgi:penicillin-binding protein 2